MPLKHAKCQLEDHVDYFFVGVVSGCEVFVGKCVTIGKTEMRRVDLIWAESLKFRFRFIDIIKPLWGASWCIYCIPFHLHGKCNLKKSEKSTTFSPMCLSVSAGLKDRKLDLFDSR